jgi:predicted  nucleic acid-binding Zn-ribbon protein
MAKRVVLEAEEKVAIDGLEVEIAEAAKNCSYFEEQLHLKKQALKAALSNLSVSAIGDLKLEISGLEDLIAENQRIHSDKKHALDAVLGKQAERESLDRARKEVHALEEEKAQLETQLTEMRALQASLPPQISRAEWRWNCLLWEISRKRDILQNLQNCR